MRTTVLQCLTALVLVGVLAPSSQAQNGTFMGVVTRDTLGVPIARAEVRLPALNRAVETNAVGEFRFSDLPAGRYLVAVRAVGYRVFTDSVDIPAGHALDAELTLSPIATRLDTLITTAKPTKTVLPRLQAFEDRRAAHITGHFIGDSALRANDNVRMASLLAMLPGIRAILDPRSTGVYLATGRNTGDGRPAFQASSRPCYMSVFIDGRKVYENNSNMDLPNFANIKTSDYAAVEVYASSAQTPMEFSGTGSSCGAIVLWTRDPTG